MMEQLSENSAGQGDNPAPIVAVSLGNTLREARERLGLSVADVAHQIKLAPRQIEALEADDFQRLPEMPFVRGFVRGYAKILHLDDQPLLASLPQASPNSAPLIPDSVEVPFPSAHSPQRQNLIRSVQDKL
jgi:cytoskeleton protein RodZ